MKRFSAKKFLILISILISLPILGCSSGGGGGDSSADTESFLSDSEPRTTSTRAGSISFCGTEEPDNSTRASLATSFSQFLVSNAFSLRSNQSMLAREVEIPVIFHVISSGPSIEEGEIPDSSITEQMNVLNQAFSGQTGGVATPFRFRLAGINRVRNPDWFVMSPGSDSQIDAQEALKQGGNETLNVYTASIQSENADSQILGYALLPVFISIFGQWDGVVLNYRALPGGAAARYNIGHVLVHEVGHWLGLLHTFDGECDGLFGDLVPDTPKEKIPSPGDFCPIGRDSCEEHEGMDPVHNHMTYTEDGCRFEFTPNQVDFMTFSATVFRQMSVL